MPTVPRWANPSAPAEFTLSTIRRTFFSANHQLNALCVAHLYDEARSKFSDEPSDEALRYTDEIRAELARVTEAVERMLLTVEEQRMVTGP